MDATVLAGWDNFYVIVGSAAAGLTGLTFVVITLVRDAGRVQAGGLKTFVTPTIVHFSGVLGFAAFVTMPHQGVLSLSIGFALGGSAGLAYTIFIAVNTRRLPDYTPVWEDWLWNVIAPVLAYGCLCAVAIAIWHAAGPSLYAVAAAALLVLFAGIHNAWDIAVWISMKRPEKEPR
jgi:hypothetical protein